MTNDKKQPGLPVVEVDQAFPLMTTDGVSRAASPTGATGDQGPTVSAAIRDVLGWRPRVQDPKAFTAALSASFQLSTVEDHVVARYVPRGVAVQADLGGVTGGQASLYLRAKAAHEQITRMLESLQPLRTDADPQDCEAYRGLVRDSVRRIVLELGREGGPRVPLVDSAFGVLTGYQPATSTPLPRPAASGFVSGPMPPAPGGLAGMFAPQASFASSGRAPGSVPTAVAEIDPDTVPGQLGALRDRFGLDDDHVNTVDEEKQRTSFWTLVELVTDLQRSWDTRRLDFTLATGSGFLGTDLVQISRLLAATAEQIDEFEAVLDSVLVSAAERQTVVLDRRTGLTLDDLVQWLRVFVTEDGPNIIRDSGRDGLVSSFTPTAVALLLTLRNELVRRLVPCGGPSCAGGCQCGHRGQVTCIPLGCCTQLPPGMYAGRVKIAVSALCGLVQRLTDKAIRIGRFAGAVLLDLSVVPFDSDDGTGLDFVRVEVRGLHLRPTYVPAFISDATGAVGALVYPLQGSASADADRLSAIFQLDTLPTPLTDLLVGSGAAGVLMPASEVPLAVVDGELGRVVQGPAVTTWPRLQPAGVVAGDGGTNTWDDIPENQRFVPQSPFEPVDPVVDDGDCVDECEDGCEGCDCGCHLLTTARSGLATARRIVRDERVRGAAQDVRADFEEAQPGVADRLLALLDSDNVTRLLDAMLAVDHSPAAERPTPWTGDEIEDEIEAEGAAQVIADVAVEEAAEAEAVAGIAEQQAAQAAAVAEIAEQQAAGAGVAAELAEEQAAEATDTAYAAQEQAAEAAVAAELAEEQATDAEVVAAEAVGYARSDPELAELERLRRLVDEQSGRLEVRIKKIQDSPQIRRFIVAALRAQTPERTADGPRTDETER